MDLRVAARQAALAAMRQPPNDRPVIPFRLPIGPRALDQVVETGPERRLHGKRAVVLRPGFRRQRRLCQLGAPAHPFGDQRLLLLVAQEWNQGQIVALGRLAQAELVVEATVADIVQMKRQLPERLRQIAPCFRVFVQHQRADMAAERVDVLDPLQVPLDAEGGKRIGPLLGQTGIFRLGFGVHGATEEDAELDLELDASVAGKSIEHFPVEGDLQPMLHAHRARALEIDDERRWAAVRVPAEIDGVGDPRQRPTVDLGLEQRLKNDHPATRRQRFERADDPLVVVLDTERHALFL